jgi:hypothetical protein
MNAIHWPILSVGTGTLDTFVEFWDRCYTGYDEEFYQANIGQPLTKDRIAAWFEWKNGTPLSANKKRAVTRFASTEECVAHDADAEALAEFLNRPGGAVWRIFWLHLQHPAHFPIYDQHVHRAMAFLLKWPDLEPPAGNPTKVRVYLEEYRSFFARFHSCDPRQADRALWSFGRFLKSGYGGILTAPAAAAQ